MPLEPGTHLYHRYRIERVLGQGGFGAVYLATDENFDLPVAVKENLNASPDTEKQFRREALLLATLRHPSLPRVTNHFVLGDQQYLVMDYVEGDDLQQRVERDGPCAEADVLRWAEEIGEALTYLHNYSPPILHRDVKPANIKITPAGEAVLVDFGIAKSGMAGQKTTTGAMGVSPGFAPPEQYGAGRTDVRTDVYALGATLYNLLTGQTPPESVERLLGQATLTPPEQLRPGLSPAVSAALKKALEIKSDQRFASIEAFRAALADPHFTYTPARPSQTTVPAATPPATVTRARPRRNSRPAAFLASTLLVVAGLATVLAPVVIDTQAVWRQVSAWLGLPQAVVEVTALPAPTATATALPSTATGQPATPAPLGGSPTGTFAPTSTPTLTPSATPAPQVASAANAQAWRLYADWQAGDTSVLFALSPDGQTVALPNEQGVDVFDLTTGAIVQRYQGFVINDAVRGLAILPDSLLVQFDDEILRWNTQTNNAMERFPLPGRDLSISPDGSLMAVRDKYISVLDLQTRQLRLSLGTENTRQQFAFSPDGAYFALTNGNNAELWNVRSGQRERTLAGHGEPAGGLIFTADGTRLISAAGDVWEVATGALLAVFDSSTDLVTVSPNGQIIVGNDGSVWDATTGKTLGVLPQVEADVRRLAFTPDGQFLVWQAPGGRVRIWAIDSSPAGASLTTPTPPVVAAREKISPFNLMRLTPLAPVGQGDYARLIFSADHTQWAGWRSGEVEIFEPSTRQARTTFNVGGSIVDAAFLGNDFLLVINARTGVERWEIATGRLKQSYSFTGRRIVASPDGSAFAVQDRSIQVVDVITGKLNYQVGSIDSEQDFLYTPDGKFMVLAVGSGVGIWDAGTGRQTRQFSGHGVRTRGLALSPDGQRLVSASGDVWDWESGQALAAFDSEAQTVALSPDALTIYGDDGKFWDGQTGQYLGALGFQDAHLLTTLDGQFVVVGQRGDYDVLGIAPIAAHRRPSGGQAKPLELLPLANENITRLNLVGWWGEDQLLDVLLTRDLPSQPVAAFGSSVYKFLALSPNGQTFTAVDDQGLQLLNPTTGGLVDEYQLFLNPETIQEVAYLGSEVLVLKPQGIERWDLSQQVLRQYYNVTGQRLRVSANQQWLALEHDGAVQVIDAASGAVTHRFRSVSGPQEYQFSPDGQSLALTAGLFVEVYDLGTGQRVANLRGHGARTYGLLFSPEGDHLIAASGDVWNLTEGKLATSFTSGATRLALTPNGQLLVGDDGVVRETTTFAQVGTLTTMRAPAVALHVTSDGQLLLWHTGDGRLYVWGVKAQAPTPAPTPGGDVIRVANAAQVKRLTHLGRGRLLSAVWSPDETYLAVNTTQNAVIYRGASLERVTAFLDATALAFDQQNRVLLGGAAALHLVDVTTGEVVRTFGQTDVTAGAFSPDGKLMAIGGVVADDSRSDGLAVIELSDGLVRVLTRGTGRYKVISDLEFSANSQRLAASFPGTITLWNMETNTQVHGAIVGNTGPATISPDSQYVAYFTNRFVIETLDQGGQYRTISANGTEFFPGGIDLPNYAPLNYSFTPSGRLLIIYEKINQRTHDRNIALVEWNIDTGGAQVAVSDLLALSNLQSVYLEDYENDAGRHTPVFQLGPQGTTVSALTGDGLVRTWRYGSNTPTAMAGADTQDLMAVNPDGQTVTVPDAQGNLRVIDLDTGLTAQTIFGAWYPTRMLYASPSVLMLWQAGGTLTWLDVTTGDVIETVQDAVYTNPNFAAVSPDGRWFAQWSRSASRDSLKVFSLIPGRAALDLGRFPRPDYFTFAPEGQRLAVVRGSQVEVWNLQSAQIQFTLAGQGRTVGQLFFTPDGSRLIAASGEIWSLTDGTLAAAFDSTVDAIALSPDGQVIVGRDGTLWAASTGQPIDTLKAVRAPAFAFTFTSDGRRILWQNEDGVIEIWGLP